MIIVISNLDFNCFSVGIEVEAKDVFWLFNFGIFS